MRLAFNEGQFMARSRPPMSARHTFETLVCGSSSVYVLSARVDNHMLCGND